MSRRNALLWSLVGQVCLLGCALAHRFAWGAHRFGMDLTVPVAIFAGLTFLGFVFFAGLPYLRLARAPDALCLSFVWRGGILLTLAALLVPPFLSSDVFDYLARGRVEAFHGANPYLVAPAEFPADPVMAPAQWPDYPLPYGPILALLQAAISGLAGGSIVFGVYAFKACFAVCHLLTAWFLHRCLRLAGDAEPARGLFLFLWNPWILLEVAGQGHNDALMLLFLVIMMQQVLEKRMGRAALSFGLALLTKHGCAVVGPLLGALAWRCRQLAGFAGGAALAVAVAGLLAWRYFLEQGAVDALLAQTAHRGASLQAFVVALIGGRHAGGIALVGYLLVLLFLVWILPRMRDAASFGRGATRCLLVFALLGLSLYSPWYQLWWLPFLLVFEPRRRHRVMVLLAFAGPFSYLAFVCTRSLGLDHQALQWGLTLLLPLLLVFGGGRIRGSDHSASRGVAGAP